jgi:hypothetical protein
MKIRFEITIEDEIAYRQAVFYKTATGNWTIVLAILFPIVTFNGIVTWLPHGNLAITALAIAGAIVLQIGWFCAFQKLRPWLIDWHTRRDMAGLKGRMALGFHEMELGDDLLIVATELAIYQIDLRAIKSIDIDELRSTVTLNSGITFVVPRFPLRNARFISELRFRWENFNLDLVFDDQVPIETRFEERRPSPSEITSD